MLLRMLDRLEEIIISFLMAAATIIIFIAVLHRYGVGWPVLYPYLIDINLSWAQELCIYMFVWMAKFGAAYGVRTGIHVGVDVLINMMGVESRRKVVLFGLFGGALFTGIVFLLSARFVYHIYEYGQVSQDLEAPMWIVYLAVPLGTGLMCFRFLQVAWHFWRTNELPHVDHGHVDGLEENKDVAIPAVVSTSRETSR